MGVARSAFNAWKFNESKPRIVENEKISKILLSIYDQYPDKGYRRLNDDLKHYHSIYINDKRALRLCRINGIKSTIKYDRHSCTVNSNDPKHIYDNILNREFYADTPNKKWLTDVTEFKWKDGKGTHKIYLSAILDLYDRRIVSYELSNRNDNPLVFNTLDKAIEKYPDAHPLLHTDRGVQYTSHGFYHKLEIQGIIHSMSRIGKCIDNGPMEGFWGILKREKYYGKKFKSEEELIHMIESYIRYYNFQRVQRKLGVLTPMEKYQLFYAA